MLQAGNEFEVQTVADQMTGETWFRLGFRTDGPSMSTHASFSALKYFSTTNSPFALRMSLQDFTAGTTLFDFATPDFAPLAEWSGNLAAGHAYVFDFTVFADALPAERVHGALALSITAQPVPEPATAALLLAGLGLTTCAARRRRAMTAPARP